MGPHRYSELGRTLGILGDQLPWYWRLTATGSSWLILAGFILFPLAMERDTTDLNANKDALIGTAIILLTIAALLSALYYVRWRRSSLLFDTLFFPCFSSCFLGLFNVLINVFVRRLQPLSTVSIIVVTIGAVSTAFYGIIALYHSDSWLSIPNPFRRHRRKPEASIDDIELQRRQLLRLYLQPDRAPSMELSQSTFRIDLPDGSVRGADDDVTVATPQSAYERGPSRTDSVNSYDPHTMPHINSFSNHSAAPDFKSNPLRNWRSQRTSQNPRHPLAELIS